jgi:hypothetical protein
MIGVVGRTHVNQAVVEEHGAAGLQGQSDDFGFAPLHFFRRDFQILRAAVGFVSMCNRAFFVCSRDEMQTAVFLS